MTVNALIITGFGLNCERETETVLQACGAHTTRRHLNDLLDAPEQLLDHHLLAFIGGFAFGDHLGAGTVFANRLKYRLRAPLERFVNDGRLVIGICNGFQTLTRLGLVPALGGLSFTPEAALAQNDQGVFRDAWVNLKCDPESPCIFTRGLDTLPLPIRHGEGKFVAMDDATLAAIEARHLAAIRYVNPDGSPATAFPHNPNGSQNAIAGICDPTGRVFGLMPHPEAYMSPYNHPDWPLQKIAGTLPKEGLGLAIFRNAVEFARKELAA